MIFRKKKDLRRAEPMPSRQFRRICKFVFEELIHLHQYATNKCDGTRLSRIRCEIEAKEKILKCASAYQLTDLDISITKAVLEQDYLDLEEYLKGGGLK